MNSTITSKQPTPAPTFSLMGIIEALFSIQMREQLNKEAKGDQSNGAYHWGM